MNKLKIGTVVLVALCAAVMPVLSGTQASAQSKFPSRPINFMIPYPPGGWFDAVSRPMCDYSSKALRQPVVPVNKPGGSGTLVLSLVKATAPDGYNVAVGTSSLFSLPPQQDMNFDAAKDFTYISRTVDSPLGIAVKADSPWKTLKDLVAYARANPGKIKYGTASPRGSLGFNMIIIGKKEGIQWEMVPFAGGQLVVNALLGGHIQAIMQGSEWIPHVDAGTLRLLAIAGEKRWKRFPNVPCTGELGYDSTTAPVMMVGPAGMPQEIVKLLDTTFKASLQDPGTIKVMEQFALQNAYMDHGQVTAWAMKQIDFYKKFIKEIGVAKP
ncbi:MAG TPA: tripartite tricarboxylate transporter substrate binding protein [Syntrophorhabdales bacterium]|nr:tripartite tricarboxylate transporter substrate binding protein [Syntrophorhabdales bacterium]